MNIAAWLQDEGFEPQSAAVVARAVLEEAGLTTRTKESMADYKQERARETLAAALQRVCASPGCRRVAASTTAGRRTVEVLPGSCEVCGGSNNLRAAREMITACRRAGTTRILIVGGTNTLHDQLALLLAGSPIELRCVAGSESAPQKKVALANLAWAQVLVMWASTPLKHKVSVSYTDERPASLPLITVSRRGLEALCSEVTACVSGTASAWRRA